MTTIAATLAALETTSQTPTVACLSTATFSVRDRATSPTMVSAAPRSASAIAMDDSTIASSPSPTGFTC